LPGVHQRVVLHTIDGAADLLIEELRALSTIHSIRQISATTVECGLDGPLQNLAGSGLYAGSPAYTERFGRLERLPWATNLIVAEVLTRLAKLRPGQHVLDPFCGTGTILLSVHRREPAARVAGFDHDPHALELAARNGCQVLTRANAAELPVADGSVDRVITNLPFGKQVGSHRINRSLYPAFVSELDRILTTDGRAVLLTEDKRLLRAAIEKQQGLKVVRERLLKYNGATPTAYTLTRLRRRARSQGVQIQVPRLRPDVEEAGAVVPADRA
jgi:ubiquinone/menaquinone biosynthesis C-methylase UbiE